MLGRFQKNQQFSVSFTPYLFNRKGQGFTILELLIVIALIGLLASILLVSFEGAKERTRIAQGWQFSDSLRAALQMEMVAWWPLDKIEGNLTPDNWFEGLDGTVSGAQVEEGIVNNALRFNGTSDYVTAAASPSLTNAALHYTVEVWVKPQVDNDYWTGVVGKPGRNYNFWLGESSDPNGGYIHHRFHTTAGINDYCPNTSGDSIPMNKWTHVVLTNDGSRCRTYINAKVESERTFTASLIADSTPLYIGRNLDGGNGNYFRGLIDEVRIYGAALPQTVIQQHYTQGLKRHQNLTKR